MDISFKVFNDSKVIYEKSLYNLFQLSPSLFEKLEIANIIKPQLNTKNELVFLNLTNEKQLNIIFDLLSEILAEANYLFKNEQITVCFYVHHSIVDYSEVKIKAYQQRFKTDLLINKKNIYKIYLLIVLGDSSLLRNIYRFLKK